jgi:hypothetical protein
MIVKGAAKKYIGAISSELKAARMYDKYALIIQGLQVKIRFLTITILIGKNKLFIHKR